MGSINKRPIAPQQPIYFSPPATTTPSVSVTPTKTEDQISAESRTESLLRRSRGSLGNIVTSFRGFLGTSDNAKTDNRKTLLGE